MKIKNLIRTFFLLTIILATISVSAQVESNSNKRGDKKDGAMRDKETSMERVKTKIEGLNAEMARYMRDGSINRLMKFYSNGAIVLPNYDKKLIGKGAIRNNWDESMKSGMKFISVILKTHSIQKAGNYFYEIGEYEMIMSIPGVPENITDIGKTLVIWEKLGKEFKIKVEMWNTDVNPMNAFMNMDEK